MSSEDATIALKGLLGIANQQIKAPVLAKKKNKKKDENGTKKKTKSVAARGESGGESNGVAPSASNSSANKRSGRKKKQNNVQNPRRKKNDKKSKEKSKGENNSNTNFAWSAFQSPPPPSNLPLPVFGSESFDNVFDDEKESGGEEKTRTTSSQQGPEDLEREETRIKNAHADTSPSPEKTDGSISGLDFAALTINNVPNPPGKSNEKIVDTTNSAKQTNEHMDPLTMLMNPSYGSNVNIGMNSQHVGGHYQHPLTYNPYGMHFQTAPNTFAVPNHHMGPEPYMLQGYVPSNSIHMMASPSPGYSVPVVDTHGASAPIYGQHAMMHTSYGHMNTLQGNLQQSAPPHLVPGMPPPTGNIYGQHQKMYQQQPQQNLTSTNISKHMSDQKSRQMPVPGSWAAKAATIPNTDTRSGDKK